MSEFKMRLRTMRIDFAALPFVLGIVCAAISFFLFGVETALISCLLGWTMLAIAVVDFRRFIIPDILSLPSIPAGLFAASLWGDELSNRVLEHALAALVGASTLYAIRWLYAIWRKREGLGLGDVKLAAVAGAWTGFAGLGHVLLLACILAFVYVLLVHFRDFRSIRGSTPIAFGVFLAPSIWIVWFAENVAVHLGLSAFHI
jgi:leader peptidase (prepilin peptidase)/N-methyltransferase